VVDDVEFAIVARRVRRPVGNRRLVAVAGAQGTSLAVAGQGGDKSDHAVAPAFLERRRRGASVLGDAPRGMDA